MIDSHAKVKSIDTLTSQSAEQAQKSAKIIYTSLLEAEQGTTITLTNEDVSSLVAAAHHAIPSLTPYLKLYKGHTQIKLSYRLLDTNLYLNISTVILNSKEGLKLGLVEVGDISLSGLHIVNSSQWLLNTFVNDDLGTSLFSMIETVDNSKGEISLRYSLPSNASDINEQSTLLKLRDKLSPFGNVEAIQYYLNELLDFSSVNQSSQLFDYLTFMLKTAHDYPSTKGGVVEENYSALMALVLYFGHDKFSLLVGDFRPLSSSELEQRSINRETVVFGGRVDLQKHFIYSLAFQLFIDGQISDAIGVFKELLDANHGGTGFSFADLLADRVGTRFAQLATKSADDALHVQQQFRRLDITENFILPEYEDLPEGIDDKLFQQTYINIKSIPYLKMLNKIDKRLFATPLYRSLM